MGFLLAVFVALARPDMPSLSEADWKDLRAGKVVVRAETDSQKVLSTGFVLVDLAPERLWPHVLDVKARIPENNTLTAVEEYRRASPTEWYLRSEMSVFGLDIVFHNRFEWFPEEGYASYTLDPTRPNDLIVCDGWYLITPVESRSLLAFQSVSESEVYAPGWIRKWMANDSMENVLAKLRARAERLR